VANRILRYKDYFRQNITLTPRATRAYLEKKNIAAASLAVLMLELRIVSMMIRFL